MTFEGKTVWITGATSGIGEALARAFAEAGARLVLSARSEERLRVVQAACAHPEHHHIAPFDLSDSDSTAAAARQVVERGPIEILVNNAGISQRSQTVETALAVDRRIMEINFFGAVTLTKAVLPSMLARKAGHIVVISSLAGKFGAPRRSAYAASKHALHGFFDVLRTEVHDEGLHVTIICPGYIRTNISKNALKGDSSVYGLMDRRQAEGLAPEACARRILRAVRRKDAEVYIGGPEVLGVYIRRFFPNMFNRLIRRVTDV